jgi:chromosome segregation ATPase
LASWLPLAAQGAGEQKPAVQGTHDQRVKKLEESVDAISDQLRGNLKIWMGKSRIGDLEAKVDNLAKQLREGAKDWGGTSRIGALEAKVDKLIDQLRSGRSESGGTTRVGDLESRLKSHTEDIKKLAADIKQLREKGTAGRQGADQQYSKLDSLSKEFDKIKSIVQKADGRLDKIESKIDSLIRDLDRAKNDTRKLEGRVDKLESRR